MNTPPRRPVIDLFAGAGGLSLGAARAGFDLVGAVETDKHALATHKRNFPATQHLDFDVAGLSGAALMKHCGLVAGELEGLIGGPPCQGFSVIGKQNPDDLRNDLFGHFMRLVDETRPAFFVAENVPGILHEKNAEMLKAAFNRLPKNYVVLDPFKAEAFKFGAPTVRKRLFFIGFDPSKVNALTKSDLDSTHVPDRTTVKDALYGLPIRIRPTWLTEETGWRKVKDLPKNYFGLRAQGLIPAGVGDPAGIARFIGKTLTSGNLGTRHSDDVALRYGSLAHGETDPITKSTRLKPEGFCPTLRAGTAADKGSFQAVRPIHYSTARVITPREAARLQGFPDWFVLHPTKWHSFRQIGNSVSPMVAEAVLKKILSKLK